MSDTISFEKVKVFFWEEADKAKNRDDLLERVIQRAYQQGKEDAVKDGDAGMYPEALNGNAHIMQPRSDQDNLCGSCLHWHPKPLEEQETGILIGDCDKFDSLGIFEDECYDETDGCFELKEVKDDS